LGELLPPYFLHYSKDNLGWIVTFRQKHKRQEFYTDAPTEADDRAKMLIALLERGLLHELVTAQD
jgi:hypothetical protein